jgi:hypothetical protein
MRKLVLSAAAILLAIPALTGCGIRHNLTPELMTLQDRPVDVENTWAIMCNENWRMFWSDLQRASYTDRPSRLTPEPLPR